MTSMKINLYPSMLQVEREPTDEDAKNYKALRDYLSLPVKGAHFAKQKNRFAADRTHFITEVQGMAAAGFLPVILKWFEANGIPYKVADYRGNLPAFNENFSITDADITLRDYQEAAVRAVNNVVYDIPFPIGTLNLATNAGKTWIAWFLRRAYGDVNMIVLIPAALVFKQTVAEYKQRFADDVGIIYGNVTEWKPVIISTPKTLYNRMFEEGSITPRMLAEKGYKIVAFDEMHLSTGKEFVQLLKKLPMPIRVGLSGTPMDHSDPVLVLRSVGNFGPTLYKMAKQDLIDKGISQKPIVKILYVPPVFGENYKETYTNGIQDNPTRAALIRSIIETNHANECVLVTCNHSVHAYNVYQMMDGMESVEVTDSKDSQKKAKLKAFTAGETKVLVSTMIVRVGLNMPLIRAVIQAQGGKNMISLSQVSGRGERNDGVNTTFMMYDFMDDSPFLRQHSLERIMRYQAEGFEVHFEYPADENGYPKVR